MRIISMAVIAVSVSACIGWARNDSKHYSLYIDPAFTDDQANDIVSAATEWQVDMGNYITFDGAGKENGQDTINVYPTTLSKLTSNESALGEEWSYGVNSKIDICTDTNDFRRIALHEIGHSLSANHIGSGNIMCASIGCAGPKVTCADVTEVCKHWGWDCNAASMPICQSK